MPHRLPMSFKQFDPVADTETRTDGSGTPISGTPSNNSIRLRILKHDIQPLHNDIKLSFKQFDPVADTET